MSPKDPKTQCFIARKILAYWKQKQNILLNYKQYQSDSNLLEFNNPDYDYDLLNSLELNLIKSNFESAISSIDTIKEEILSFAKNRCEAIRSINNELRNLTMEGCECECNCQPDYDNCPYCEDYRYERDEFESEKCDLQEKVVDLQDEVADLEEKQEKLQNSLLEANAKIQELFHSLSDIKRS